MEDGRVKGFASRGRPRFINHFGDINEMVGDG
jgi:hypothetical protein